MSSYSNNVVSFLTEARALIEDSTFQRNCIDRLLDSKVTPNVSTIQFVNGLGRLANDAITNNVTRENLWGISYRSCVASCYYTDMPLPFDYSTFSSAVTNYLLPWLALTAQLPYETGHSTVNLMALFLALGSPVLITYSLSLTVIHSYKLKELFGRLQDANSISQQYSSHLATIREVLQRAQHVPLRASQRGGWLSSLLVLKENDDWWESVLESLTGRMRDFSPSALAQIGVAIVAWLLTILAALSTKLGDPDTGLQMASGSLWIWLVPVVFGYIWVGVPNSSRATPEGFARPGAHKASRMAGASSPAPDRDNGLGIDGGSGRSRSATSHSGHARAASHTSRSPGRSTTSHETTRAPDTHELQTLSVPLLAQRYDSADDDDDTAVEHTPDAGIDDNRLRGIRTSGGWFNDTGDQNTHIPMALGLPVLGDSATSGAAYSYARSLEFPFFVDLLSDALAHSIGQDPDRRLAKARRADSEAIAKQCGPDWQAEMKLNPFPKWSQVSADSWHRMIIAAAMALFVQWGTTMASFMLAYLTPVIGLGCRSGSYVAYGITSTVAWMLLVLGQLCSNEAMRILQEEAWAPTGSIRPEATRPRTSRSRSRHQPQQQPPSTANNATAAPNSLDRIRRQSTVQTEANDITDHLSNLKLSTLKIGGVLFRVSGKVLCILNTFWLLLTSIAEIIGGFDNCWCLANRVSASEENGWIVLFKTSADLASQANSSWAGGLAITIFVSILAIVFFVVGSPSRKSR